MRTYSELLTWWKMALIVACLGLPGAVTAEEQEKDIEPDVIFMENGDRLTGEVVSKAGDTIKFKTPYAEASEATPQGPSRHEMG